jgi:DNA-directed RNA polymerase alpha subunit
MEFELQDSLDSRTQQGRTQISLTVDEEWGPLSAEYSYNFKGYPLYMIQFISQIIMTEIDTLAIDLVEIHENDSPLKEETIGHRLGLIPFYSENLDRLVKWNECSCYHNFKVKNAYTLPDIELITTKFCNRCSISFDVDIIAPYDGFEVKVKHMQLNTLKPELLSIIYPVPEYQNTTITKLNEGGRLRFRAYLKRGCNKDHSKWSSVVAPRLTAKPTIQLNTKRIDAYMNEDEKYRFVQQCPRNVYNYNETTNSIDIEDLNACNFCRECTRPLHTESTQKAIQFCTLGRVEDEHVLTFEIDGSLSPFRIMDDALKKIEDQLQELEYFVVENL